MTARSTDCDVCREPIPFGTLCWLRHTGRKDESGPVVVVVCDGCQRA